MNFSIVIPAYNEAATLPEVLRGLQSDLQRSVEFEIVVVDDGSTDDTAGLIPSTVRVVRHAVNRGHGAAIKSGLRAVATPVVVVFDADGQHRPADIPPLLAALASGKCLAIGARRRLWTQRRGWGNMVLNLAASALTGTWIPDLTSGLRAFRLDKALEFWKLYPERFCFESTTTAAFALRGYGVEFIPIEPRQREGGESKILPLWDGLRFLVLLLWPIALLRPLRLGISLAALLVAAGIACASAAWVVAGCVVGILGLVASRLPLYRLLYGEAS